MKHLNPRLLWLLPAALFTTVSFAQQNTAINQSGAVAAASALLDISVNPATPRGLLIPRMSEAQRLAIPAVAANDGLWVYQIAAVGNTTPNGLWYYDGSAPNNGWYRMSSGAGWLLAGSAATNPATNFLGTTDAQDLVIATQGIERMRMEGTTGFLGIANNNPLEAISVTGAVRLGTGGSPGSLTNAPGVIRYNTAPVLPAPFPAMNPSIPYHEGITQYQLGAGAPVVSTDRLENAFTEWTNEEYAGSQLLCGNGAAESANTGGVSNAGAPNFSDTPYPTSLGRGSKYQFIYTAAELTAMLLCPGLITEIDFRITSDDVQLPAPASVQIQIRMRGVPTGSVSLVGGFDLTTSQTASLGTITTVVASGLQIIPLSGFNWNGTDDIVFDISYTRAAQAGNSPSLQVNTGFANCSRYGFIGTATNGWLLHTPAPPIGWTLPTTTGLTNERPVIRLTGQAQVPTPITLIGDYVQYGGGLLVGSAAWATSPGIYRGPGVIRAENKVFDANVQLSDHVFDRYYDGAAKPGEQHLGEPLLPLDQLKDYLAANRHLPSMPSRHEWKSHGKASLGQLSTGLWETVEQQALYITELNADLKELEAEAYGEHLDAATLGQRIAAIQDSPRLTAEEKQRMIAALRQHQQDHN